MFASATIHSAATWGLLTTAFTNHGASVDVIAALTAHSVFYTGGIDACFSLNILMADLLFVRCRLRSNPIKHLKKETDLEMLGRI